MGSGWFGSGWFDTLGSGWADSSSAASGGGGAVFAMRADRPLAQVSVAPYNFGATFPTRDWDPDLLALTIMPEFLAAKNAVGQTWDQAVIAALQPGPKPITNELIDGLLIRAVADRPEALGEIVQQDKNFQIAFLQLLNISQASHPQTYLLMKLAARVGEFSMMYLKRLTTPWDLQHRPRPSQICPTLFPPVAVPGHSTYPAGHAVIAWLTRKCLNDIPQLQAHAYARSLDALAHRVCENRVIAGMHFQDDVDAGKIAGETIYDFIFQCALYSSTLGNAQAEWVP